ncbi:ribosome maturation factor RimM [Alphaproteobacteria bacterium]|nr:16S rRNA processing protein RimM [Alphaproteobacteria bacterium]MDC3014269.1 ribosome maturation factor RimM [Alphaproteobacteria bacterium]|tara:strand:+ start:95 stop:610 length:516 start_codon:yes stop_codon:yes gene_type:complete
MTDNLFLTDSVVLGVIVSAHGLKGQFKVKSFTKPPENLFAYGNVKLESGEELSLRLVSKHRELLICAAQEIEDRTAAESIQKQELRIERGALPLPAENEIYQIDYLGFMIVDLDKKPIGSIVGFHNFGAGDIVEVKPEGSETIFLPFTGFLKQVHIIEKQLVMNIPDGFIN